ncbi:tyrosine-type recombinase/integrase [Flavivirga aquimarina]|uniref:Tyrosine-type recombinase/integrase n=1 Tax=Flavivirga aquimarina TaxID=2027862 RepID=A0ABT8WB06_9FLAO|nr:tyrosine-type recombinase/integrase [Flavivirga aquimarina]MDO5970290.1 tyrosine-type recombinase/integrase [Flavivirga aquimarina]
MYKNTISLHNHKGQRKYLNHAERLRFLECTKNHPVDIRLFCQLIYYTGARIAEIHNLSVSGIDFSNKSVVLETLKKRKRGIYREIPLPDILLENLEFYMNSLEREGEEPLRLWRFSLRSASRYIKTVMCKADITGIQSSARGLRHGFAVHAVTKAPITLVKKWLGHGDLKTTAIYLDVVGEEERAIAEKVWFQ